MDRNLDDLGTLNALAGAAVRIFRPLVRILLSHGVSFKTCSDWLRWCYADVAAREFAIPGRKQSKSRVAVLTGLTRPDVDRVLAMPPPHHRVQDEHYNRAARVLTAWAYEADFLDADGRPMTLPFDAVDGDASFSSLVNRFSGGAPPRAVLDDLLDNQAVTIDAARNVTLQRANYVTGDKKMDEHAAVMGDSCGRLLHTIGHNIADGRHDKHLQLMVYHRAIPAEKLPEVRRYLENQGRDMVRTCDRWLHRRFADTSGRQNDDVCTSGLGIYYFQEPVTGK